MKVRHIIGTAILLMVFMLSCREEIRFELSTKDLRFSKDTLFLDTLYNKVRSEVYLVKVFNDEDKDILIPKIALQGGEESPFRINVDGSSGVIFNNVPLRKKDSLYIFVEAIPFVNSREILVEDRIVFENKGNQYITLLSVMQDAEFFIQNEKNKNIVETNTVWNSDKAKVIFGNLTIAEGVRLDIQEGTKIYFAKKSTLKLSKNSELNAQGSLGKEIIFRGERNDPRYDTIPMNWRGIVAEEGSVLNLNHTKIFGGETGIDIKKGTANIHNVEIHTFQKYGIRSTTSKVKASNLVMNNFGQSAIGVFDGGILELVHSTVVNYWKNSGNFPASVLLVTNEMKDEKNKKGILNLEIKNSILYGNNDNAIQLDFSGQNFNYQIESSLIKYGNNAGYQWENNPAIINSIKNEDPLFLATFISKMNLRLKDNSPAKGKGNPQTAQSVPLDIKKINRTNAPNMGAYQ